jgi:hypothetical protein
VRVLQRSLDQLAELGVTDRGDVEILLGMVAGLVDQQLANDPGGDRYARLLDRAIGMYADSLSLKATGRD